MHQKEFNNILKSSFKSVYTKKDGFSVNNDGIFLLGGASCEAGFHVDYLNDGKYLTLYFIFKDKDILNFIDNANIKYPSYTLALVSINMWASRGNFHLADSAGGVKLPDDESKVPAIVDEILNNINSKWIPCLHALVNRDKSCIEFIVDFVNKNPNQGFSYPFYICLYMALKNSYSFDEFLKSVGDVKNISRDLSWDIENSRKYFS